MSGHGGDGWTWWPWRYFPILVILLFSHSLVLNLPLCHPRAISRLSGCRDHWDEARSFPIIFLKSIKTGETNLYFTSAAFPLLTCSLCCSSFPLSNVQKKKKLLERLKEQLVKLNVQATDKEENKQIALGTSKLNYLDPRISIAW